MLFQRKPVRKPIFFHLLVFAMLFITFGSWAIGSAIGSSPDEDNVLTTIWCGKHATNLRPTDALRINRETTKFDGSVKPATEFCKYDPNNYKSHFDSLINCCAPTVLLKRGAGHEC